MMHNVCLSIILKYASDELKNKIVKDVVENNKFLGFAYSEFGSGTNFYLPDIKAEFTDNAKSGRLFTNVPSKSKPISLNCVFIVFLCSIAIAFN